jgi:hypothetical protein
MQHFADQAFGHGGAVRIRRIYERDAELWQPRERAAHLGRIGGLTPNAGTRDTHRAEAEACHS